MMLASGLHWIWLLPLAGALLTCLLDRNEGGAASACAGLACTAAALVCTGLLLAVPPEQVLTTSILLWPTMGFHYALQLDGWNRLALLLLVWLIPVLMWLLPAAPQLRRNQVGALALLQAFASGALLAGDGLLFYGFFELTLLPCLGLWWWLGGSQRQQAGLRFVLYTLLGSLPLLLGLLGLALWADQGHGPSTLWTDLAAGIQRQSQPVPLWIVLSCTLACVIKLPLFPFHGWLRSAYGQAPMELTICLAAVVGKLGLYAFARIVLGLMPHAVGQLVPWLAPLALLGLLYFALLAWQLDDIKESLACLSASHVQLLFLGLLSASPLAMAGTLTAVFHHGVMITTLLLLLQWLEGQGKQTTHQQAMDPQGSQRLAWATHHGWPLLSFAWVVAVAAAVGLPGLSGFVGEWPILLGTYSSKGWLAGHLGQGILQTTAMGSLAAMVLSGLYGWRLLLALPAWEKIWQPRRLAASQGARFVVPALLMLLILGGCWPQWWIRQIKPAVEGWQHELSNTWLHHAGLGSPSFSEQGKRSGNPWPALPGATARP